MVVSTYDDGWLSRIRAELPPLSFVTVFGSSTATAEDVEIAPWETLGAIVARAGLGLLTGGYEGTMRLVSESALGAGGVSIGITASSLTDRADASAYSRFITLPSVFHRLQALLDLSDACFFLPGGIGTAVELLVGLWLTDRQLMVGKPLVLLGAHWQQFVGEALRSPVSLRSSVDQLRAAVVEVETLEELAVFVDQLALGTTASGIQVNAVR